MIKKLAGVVALAAMISMLSGCLTAPVMPPPGIIFTKYAAPLDYDQEMSMVGMREGRAETKSYVGLVALGDASINTAAQNGGITTIHGADYEYFNVLGVFQRYTTVVRGE